MYIIGIIYLILVAFVLFLLKEKKTHRHSVNSIEHRILVSGIRGKSSVTRYISAILRDAGLRSFGKTTGSAARVILPNGEDSIIKRRGNPNVNEQVRMLINFAKQGAEAVVMENMAINPDYQDWIENKVLHSTIGIITNIRTDHQEEMGQSLEDIAKSICRSIPHNAILITSETKREMLSIIKKECEIHNTKLILAPIAAVSQSDINQFNHYAHKENIAIGMAVARLFKIPKEKAIRAMVNSRPDPGAFKIETFYFKGKNISWVNLFAVNDRESFYDLACKLKKEYSNHSRVALLNNRFDRPSRIGMFSELVQTALGCVTIVALGDYERALEKTINKKKCAFLQMGNSSKYKNANGEELLEKIVSSVKEREILIVGAANIHTKQSKAILQYVGKCVGSSEDLPLPIFGKIERLRFINQRGGRF